MAKGTHMPAAQWNMNFKIKHFILLRLLRIRAISWKDMGAFGYPVGIGCLSTYYNLRRLQYVLGIERALS